MSGSDRIWAAENVGIYGGNVWYNRDDLGGTEYIRRDRAVLAALPEVQAIVEAAVKSEREACVDECHHMAYAFENDGNYYGMRAAEMCAAAIRKRGEGRYERAMDGIKTSAGGAARQI